VTGVQTCALPICDFYDQFPNEGTPGNHGGITAEGVAWDGMPASAEITLPANGAVVFSR